MNIEMRQLRAFATVGRLGSFTKAAVALHTTQPSLSEQIRTFEEVLNLRLFDRSTRTVSLTQAGADLLPAVNRVLEDVGAVMAHALNVVHRKTGRVRLAALPSVASTLLPKAVAEFKTLHPGITVALMDALAERIVEMVRLGAVDFALTSDTGTDPHLDFSVIAADLMVIVMPQRHPLSRKRRVGLSDLLDVPVILMDRQSSVRRAVENAFAAAGYSAPSPEFEPAFMATALGMVRGGLGLTLLPSSAIEPSGMGGLAVRALDNPRLTRKLGILSERRRSFSPAAKAFADLLVTRVPGWLGSRASAKRSRRSITVS